MATTPYPFQSGAVLTASQLNSTFNIPTTTKTASYTLTAADAGTRIYMNSASATTITVNTSIFAASDVVDIVNIGAGTCTITAGTATVSTSASLALVQYAGGRLVFTSASASIFFLAGGSSYGTATGGIGSPTAVTIGGINYQYLQFNSTGTLTVTKAGFFDYLAIGGGGSTVNFGAAAAGGGGGAGQLVCGSIYLDANQTITIGGGSSFYTYTVGNISQAGNTTIAATSPFFVTALGNLKTYASTAYYGYVGGGLGAMNGLTPIAITESTGLGYRGGASDSGANNNAGGGGGSTGRGGNGTGTTGGTGGAGFDISLFIGGSSLYRAQGGGGGGSVTGGTAATNGVAGTATTTPPNGAANTGQGAGGGYGTITTGNGGSGVAYIRWRV